MVDRKTPKTTRRSVHGKKPPVVSIAIATVAVAFSIGGFGLASADNGLGTTKEFGLAEHSSAVSPVGQLSNTAVNESAGNAPVSFDISAAATQADKDHAAQAAAEEEAARAAEVECREQALQSRDEWLAQGDRPTNLEEVDWSVSRDEFIDTWSTRIDAFLDGSNLAGYGSVFAEAAWENGVDPRFSPAIANTESGRGEICFLPYNAWGWGACAWTNWEEAIESHVSGLAEGYGYCVTLSGAASYCPPTYTDWYATVQSQIELI